MTCGDVNAGRRRAVIGIIGGLLKKLALLAPDPSRPGYEGPVLIQGNPVFHAAQDQEALAGQIFFENYLSPAFAEVAAALPFCPDNIDKLDNFADAASEYLADREKAETGEGRGSLAACKLRALRGGFNFHAAISSAHDSALEAFRTDLPRRRVLEKELAHFGRELLCPAIS